MPDRLPPDVRDRAARAAQLADAGGSWIPVWDSFHDENREYWRAIVDAVAEVLAARYEIDRRAWSGAVSKASVDAYRQGRLDEQAALQARVDLLTTALTEIVVIVNHSSLSMSSTTTDLLLRSVNRAVAVLSGAPTAPVPHVCQLPDIATVREPSSFNDRRWDCPVCDARWIAMGRIVGRRSRYEWHQMPVTKTAAPTESEAPDERT